jgi:hypothetical protein
VTILNIEHKEIKFMFVLNPKQKAATIFSGFVHLLKDKQDPIAVNRIIYPTTLKISVFLRIL